MSGLLEVLLFGMGAVVGGMAGSVWGSRRQQKPDAIGTLVIPDGLKTDDVFVLTYPGFLTKEQRERIREVVEAKLAPGVRTLVLEGGLQGEAHKQTSNADDFGGFPN